MSAGKTESIKLECRCKCCYNNKNAFFEDANLCPVNEKAIMRFTSLTHSCHHSL